MKIVKLALIFIVLVGGILVAINWGAFFGGSSKETDFPEEDKLDITEECNKIRKAWEPQTEWSDDLFKMQRADIDQSKAMGLFSREGYNTVNNCLRETATNKACGFYLDALHNKTFSDAKLQAAYKGVVFLKGAEKLDKDQRIEDVEKRHQLYTGISRFVKGSHVITPHFDTSKADWVSFATLQNGVLSQARSYRQNPLFKEMEHVPGFREGLDEAKLKSMTDSQRGSFYTNLSKQIIIYKKVGV